MKNSTKPSTSKETVSQYARAWALPKPRRDQIVIVPLEILPAYMSLHNLEAIRMTDQVLLCKIVAASLSVSEGTVKVDPSSGGNGPLGGGAVAHDDDGAAVV